MVRMVRCLVLHRRVLGERPRHLYQAVRCPPGRQVESELGGGVETLPGGTVQQHLPHGAVGPGRELGKLRQQLSWLASRSP